MGVCRARLRGQDDGLLVRARVAMLAAERYAPSPSAPERRHRRRSVHRVCAHVAGFSLFDSPSTESFFRGTRRMPSSCWSLAARDVVIVIAAIARARRWTAGSSASRNARCREVRPSLSALSVGNSRRRLWCTCVRHVYARVAAKNGRHSRHP